MSERNRFLGRGASWPRAARAPAAHYRWRGICGVRGEGGAGGGRETGDGNRASVADDS